jgi:hypothetical protein
LSRADALARPINGRSEAQVEGAAMPLGEQPIEQRRAHFPDVQKPGRAGRETDNGI